MKNRRNFMFFPDILEKKAKIANNAGMDSFPTSVTAAEKLEINPKNLDRYVFLGSQLLAAVSSLLFSCLMKLVRQHWIL